MLEDFLKEQFGNKSIFNQAKSVLKIKVMVIVIRILDAFLFVIFNYNSIKAYNAKSG